MRGIFGRESSHVMNDLEASYLNSIHPPIWERRLN